MKIRNRQTILLEMSDNTIDGLSCDCREYFYCESLIAEGVEAIQFIKRK